MAKKKRKKKREPINGYKKHQVIPVTFSLFILALFALFNSKPSITGYSFVGNVIDKGQMIVYNDSGAMLLIISFAILLIITGSIIIPKYIKNIGIILNALALIIFLITIIDIFSYKIINLRLIGNFVIASFLLVYGIFILKKKISIG